MISMWNISLDTTWYVTRLFSWITKGAANGPQNGQAKTRIRIYGEDSPSILIVYNDMYCTHIQYLERDTN